jgi:transcriptional regulator with XRE-family HTH domain
MVHMARTIQTDGNAIRLTRELSGWSRLAFAAHVGMNASYLARIENGTCQASPGMLKRIADGLGVKTLDLVKVREPASA